MAAIKGHFRRQRPNDREFERVLEKVLSSTQTQYEKSVALSAAFIVRQAYLELENSENIKAALKKKLQNINEWIKNRLPLGEQDYGTDGTRDIREQHTDNDPKK